MKSFFKFSASNRRSVFPFLTVLMNNKSKENNLVFQQSTQRSVDLSRIDITRRESHSRSTLLELISFFIRNKIPVPLSTIEVGFPIVPLTAHLNHRILLFAPMIRSKSDPEEVFMNIPGTQKSQQPFLDQFTQNPDLLHSLCPHFIVDRWLLHSASLSVGVLPEAATKYRELFLLLVEYIRLPIVIKRLIFGYALET